MRILKKKDPLNLAFRLLKLHKDLILMRTRPTLEGWTVRDVHVVQRNQT
jgi:hypothetical protein